MKIIRGELTDSAVTPPNTRYDATCDCIQVTTDGTTWVQAVGQDPRSQPAYLKPPVSGSNKQCDAAANMTAWVKSIIDGLIAALTAGATDLLMANGILQIIEQIFPFAAYFINLMFQLAVDVLAVGAADLNTAFDSATYDTLTCIFFCHLDSDGRVTPDAFMLIGADVVAQLNSTAALVVAEIMFITGYVGLSNAGAIGSETGDCTGCACAWCYNEDLTTAATLWTVTVGHFDSISLISDEVISNVFRCGISFDFELTAGSTVDSIEIGVYYNGAGDDSVKLNPDSSFDLQHPGSGNSTVTWITPISTGNGTYTFWQTVTGGATRMYGVRASGTGDNPFGVPNNC